MGALRVAGVLGVKRALLVHARFDDPGGGSAVAAWALQALRDEFAITLVAWEPFDVDRLNAAYGTALSAHDFTLDVVPARTRALLQALPFSLSFVKMGLIQRRARARLRREHFDVVAGTANELDAGRKSVQYIHFPWGYWPRPDAKPSWYHLPLLVRFYRWGVQRAFALSRKRIAANVTLANSAWTAQRFAQVYGVLPQVVHPPAHVEVEQRAWSERADTIVCIGRISPEKRLLELIDIVAAVRRSGHAVSLLLCGLRDDAAYETRVRDAVRKHGDWIDLRVDVRRSEMLSRAASCRYAIHGMLGEHFGIAVAELVRLGCVTFAPGDGGPAEILGHDDRLLYDSDDDAVAKIVAVLDDLQRRESVREALAARSERLSSDRFMDEFAAACRAASAPPDGQRTDLPGLRAQFKRRLPARIQPGLGRLYRTLYPLWQRRAGERTADVVTPNGRYRVPVDAPHDMIVRAIREGDVFERNVVAACADFLHEGATIVDVGANLGQMAVQFSRIVGARGRVIAIEAHPFVHSLLAYNLEANGCSNVVAVFGAAYCESGRTLFYPEPRFWRHASYGSYGIDPRRRDGSAVPAIALDDLDIAGRVDFIKIDAQGADLDVMRGARRLIARDRMPILYEYTPEYDAAFGVSAGDYDAFIAEIGYRISRRIAQNVLIEPA